MISAYVNFIMNFLVLFAIAINILLLIAAVFKIKDYGLELLMLGMISFCVLLGVHEFSQLAITSYSMASTEAEPLHAPVTDIIMSEMFLLMASMLIFSVGVTKNKLKNFKLGKR